MWWVEQCHDNCLCGGQYDVSMGGYTSVVTAVCEVGKLTAVCGSGDEERVSVTM